MQREMRLVLRLLTIVALWIVVISCGSNKNSEEKSLPSRVVEVPHFNSDSAYAFIEKQVKFGPRVPNSEAHKKAASYLINQFKLYGAVVKEQNFEAITFDHQRLILKNIIASYFPKAKKRILLAAHWDTNLLQIKTKKRQMLLLMVQMTSF